MIPPTYVAVTPVKDEACYIGKMIESMLRQTHRPVRWVIVDDGSTDSTMDIVKKKTAEVPWIVTLSTGSNSRDLGKGEVVAFAAGLSSIQDVSYEFVVKVDGDVRLPPDYFRDILTRMQADTSWGIASGRYWENAGNGRWEPVAMPSYHAAGASKVVRRECFVEIGGFVPQKGWDTVDEIRAGLRGWRTGHFEDVRFDHLKQEGAVMGDLATHRFHGAICYRTGGGAGFLLAKALRRMFVGRPPVLGGIAMVLGYIAAHRSGEGRLVSDAEARYYRKMLFGRLTRRSMGS